MLNIRTISFSAFLFISLSANSGQSLQVTKTIQINASPDKVWEYVGDFCAIKDWHPAVKKCEIVEENHEKYRILTLQDDATIKEAKGGNNPMGYMYSITESPLPVKDYNALFDVEKKDGGTLITWTATFLSNGKPDQEAKDVISGIFEAGLNSIGEKFK